MAIRQAPLRVFMPCSGLGRMRRGFESFTADCQQAIDGHPSLDLSVFGSGPTGGARRIPSTPRHGATARALGRLAGGRSGYFAEQATFAVGLIPYLLAARPEVVFLSDISLGRILAALRPRLGASYRLVLSNGGLDAPPHSAFDHIQQLAPPHLARAIDAGVPAARQTLLPYGIQTPRGRSRLAALDRRALRDRLRLPSEDRILLSVAALDRRQKRIDKLISEVAALGERRPFLLLLGHPEPDAPELIGLLRDRLGGRFSVRSVPRHAVDDYLRAADAFVLSSVVEGLPRALLEAAARGLPCLAHSSEVCRYVLGEHGHYANCARDGSLSEAIPALLAQADNPEARERQTAAVVARFGWTHLAPRYVEMLKRAAAAPLRTAP